MTKTFLRTFVVHSPQ